MCRLQLQVRGRVETTHREEVSPEDQCMAVTQVPLGLRTHVEEGLREAELLKENLVRSLIDYMVFLVVLHPAST